MNTKQFTEENRVAWNQAAEYHRRHFQDRLRLGFSHSGFSTLDPIVTEVLGMFPLEGWKVAQPCCNNGRELLSILNLGAGSGVGFDISDEFISDAVELARIAGTDCRFVRTDVYDIGWEYENVFDLVYVSVGALTWLPDISRFFTVVSFMLKPGGYLVVYEQHPVIWGLAMPGDAAYREDAPYEPMLSYFTEGPTAFGDGLDYYGGTSYDSAPKHEFIHKVSDLINGAVRNGLDIMEFNEYPHDLTNCFGHLGTESKLPLSYLMLARKRG